MRYRVARTRGPGRWCRSPRRRPGRRLWIRWSRRRQLAHNLTVKSRVHQRGGTIDDIRVPSTLDPLADRLAHPAAAGMMRRSPPPCPRVGRRAPAPVASGVSAIARCTECGQRGGGATSPHHAARMPRRGVCAALRGGGDRRPGAALRAPLRGGQYPRTRSDVGSGRPTPCPCLSRKWRQMTPSGRASERGPQTAPPGTPRTRVRRIASPASQQ